MFVLAFEELAIIFMIVCTLIGFGKAFEDDDNSKMEMHFIFLATEVVGLIFVSLILAIRIIIFFG